MNTTPGPQHSAEKSRPSADETYCGTSSPTAPNASVVNRSGPPLASVSIGATSPRRIPFQAV